MAQAQAEGYSFPSITLTPTVGASQSLIYSGFSQGLETKQDSNSSGSKVRHSCDIIGCTVTFKRSYDLVRHKRTVHGPKVHCPYPQCTYATARSDKMKAHNRKKHFDRSKFFCKRPGNLMFLTSVQTRPVKLKRKSTLL